MKLCPHSAGQTRISREMFGKAEEKLNVKKNNVQHVTLNFRNGVPKIEQIQNNQKNQ